MEQAPLQIYLSALIFAPTNSKVRNEFQAPELCRMKRLPDTRQHWSALLQTLEGHTLWVNTVTFSEDGDMLASGSQDGTVRLWDPTTGQCLQTLEAHNSPIITVAFFLKDEEMLELGSASDDGTVRLWDLATGQCLQTLKCGRVSMVAFSNDGKTLASASGWFTKTVRLWYLTTGQCLQTLECDRVSRIAFSKDGSTLASASFDKTIRLWDITTGQCLQTIECDSLTKTP
jgi:WD40 repeat protein